MGHRTESCDTPKWFLWRWRNKLWICQVCGQAWTTYLGCAYDSCIRSWKEWNGPEQEGNQPPT